MNIKLKYFLVHLILLFKNPLGNNTLYIDFYVPLVNIRLKI